MTLQKTKQALEEIRQFTELRLFKTNKEQEFCKRYSITGMQLNFLISIIAVERCNENIKNSYE